MTHAAAEDAVIDLDSAELEAQLSLLREIEHTLETEILTTDQLIEDRDFELESIISFVKESILYEPYQGSLRGIGGTLAGRAGNSLDQSLLLAKAIKDIGYDARIVSGELDNNDSLRLQAQAIRGGYQEPALDASRFHVLSGKLEAALPDSENWSSSDLSPPGWLQSIDHVAREIDRTVAGNSENRHEHAEFESPYYAVQYRESASGPWMTVHPAFSGDDSDITLAASAFYVDTIPGDLQHRVSLQVYLDRTYLGKSESVAITPSFTLSTALGENLSWTYRSVPDKFIALDEWTPEALDSALLSSEYFVPQLNEGPIGSGLVFDLHGNAVPLDVAMSTLAPLFRTLGNRLDDAADALNQVSPEASDPDSQVRQLQRVWLEISVASPSGTERRFKRTLAEFSGDKVAFYRQLVREVNVTIEVGKPSFADFLQRYARAQANVIEMLLRGAVPRVDDAVLLEDARFLASLDGRLFYLFSDLVGDQVTGESRYRRAPSIVLRYRSALSSDDQDQGFDIVSNERVSRPGTDPQAARRSAIRNGVVDTFIEKALLSEGGVVTTSAYDVLVSEAGHIGEQVNKPSDEERPNLAWWQVDGGTGETVGRLYNGWGGVVASGAYTGTCMLVASATLTEYVKQLTIYSRNLWGPMQWRNIQFCSTAAMAIALAATGGVATNWGALAEMCETIPHDNIQALCIVTLRTMQAANLFVKSSAGQNMARTAIRRFFLSCVSTLRTGRLIVH